MKVPWKALSSFQFTLLLLLFILAFCWKLDVCYGQEQNDYDSGETTKRPKELDNCNGVFLTYNFQGRKKEFPHVKNVSKQAWAFEATASLTNVGDEEVVGWNMFVGFQHNEILVSADGAVLLDAGDLPANVTNGTLMAGSAMTDLQTAINTANDFDQMSVNIKIKGTMFGSKTGTTPMPKTIKLVNDGFKCPAATRRQSKMFVCCKKDPKAMVLNKRRTKFPPRRYGDITIGYDVLQASKSNYYAQITMDAWHPLARLDHWNVSWQWQKGEFISSMKGAYSHMRDVSQCLYGTAGKFYGDFNFNQQGVNCDKSPILSDLPPTVKDDEKIGKLPYCCRNGSLLPPSLDPSRARSVFQINVMKMPPDNSMATAITPPLKWQIDGVINPVYRCGQPMRVSPKEFPDPSGLQAVTLAVASWQVACNMTKPKPKQNRCCVSFSAFYNDSVIPCNTCACGCSNTKKCDPNARSLLLPPEALLVPFVNRTAKAIAWAALKHRRLPKKLPCGDNCPLSINWHVNSDSVAGWTARMTIFNWGDNTFEDWFSAISFKRSYHNFDKVFSFNGTKVDNISTLIFNGLKDMNYLMGETNGTHQYDPQVPGKQQSVITFNKKNIKNFDIRKDGFPTKVYFNGEECALPPHFSSVGDILDDDDDRGKSLLLVIEHTSMVNSGSLLCFLGQRSDGGSCLMVMMMSDGGIYGNPKACVFL
ncbi:hypothetical protein K1719_038898 [Acacia pycnantha]|nr:hypothetical protein K1719_038898 [Acacia pycnantha]